MARRDGDIGWKSGQLEFEKRSEKLVCARCNQVLVRNNKLNIVYCRNCGLTQYHLEIPQHLIISTTNSEKE